MAEKALPTPEVLRQLLRYEPETGKLFWLERSVEWFSDGAHSAATVCARWNTRFAGAEAFTANGLGYRHGHILSCKLLAHRVIWAMIYGEWPEAEIDHIDGDRANNRSANLRSVTHAQNARNQGKRARNRTGTTGVDEFDGRWRARIFKDGVERSLGVFDAREDAIAARKKAERDLGFHSNHGTRPAYSAPP